LHRAKIHRLDGKTIYATFTSPGADRGGILALPTF
jgi:hypothetical protein